MKTKKQLVRDSIYIEYMRQTNMTVSELIKWKNNPLSKKASLSRKPINLALRLKTTPRYKWTTRYYRGALKAISYLKRAKKIKGKNYISGTNITYNDAALRNWGFNKQKKSR